MTDEEAAALMEMPLKEFKAYQKKWNREVAIEGTFAYLLTHHDIDDMPGFRD